MWSAWVFKAAWSSSFAHSSTQSRLLHHALPQSKINLNMASTAEPARQLYWTKRSSEEMDRLDLQHYLLLIASGGLLHPPSVDLSSARRILDCATGTTVWARHVLAGGGGDATNQQITLRPDCIFDICDLSDSQLPDPLPKGIHEFFKYDIIKPFPEERRGTLDPTLSCPTSGC